MKAAVSRTGKLHVMVNNAGVTPPLKPLHEYDTGAALTVDGGFTGGDQNNMAWMTPDPRDLSDLKKQ